FHACGDTADSHSFPTRRSSDLSRLPSTRNTFQPGRASPFGGTTPVKLCTCPAPLTKVPEVSPNVPIGNSTVAYAFIASVTKGVRSEEHTSELQSRENLVCRLLL